MIFFDNLIQDKKKKEKRKNNTRKMAIPGTESYYSYWKSKIDIYQVNMIRKNKTKPLSEKILSFRLTTSLSHRSHYHRIWRENLHERYSFHDFLPYFMFQNGKKMLKSP